MILLRLFLFLAFLVFPVEGIGQQVMSKPCREGTECDITMTFYDQNNQPINPDTITLYVDEQSTKTRLINGVAIPTPSGTPNGNITYRLNLCASRSVTGRPTEQHVGTVVFTKNGSPSGTDWFVYNNEALPGIDIRETTPGTCVVTPYASPTPTRTPTP